MRMLDNSYIEKNALQDSFNAYKQLTSQIRDLYTARQWRTARHIVTDGIAKGAYPKDIHGVDSLLHTILSCLTLHSHIGTGTASMLTVLLAPAMEHGTVTLQELETEFGSDVSHMVECLTKVRRLYREHLGDLSNENFRKLLLSFAEDIMVIICLIADRYVLMKTMLAHTDKTDYRLEVASECSQLYIPIAHRLGLYAIKSELEDLVVKYEHREVYDDIARQLNETKSARDAYIKDFMQPVSERLEQAGLKFTMKGRTKSISSIWNKMKAQNTTLDRIYDLFAIRIIIDAPPEREKELCWQAYSIVTDMYNPNPKRLRDWLSIPKSNGYESLHITVYGPENRWVEVQIRTRRMDDIAERGIAAHWSYKGIKSQGDADRIMASIRDILENNQSPDELVRELSMGLYQEEIFVFTPGGDVHKLPKGATVLDFAFGIHTRLGLQCVGAHVGNRNVKINYQLHSGDTVEVLTSAQQTPKPDWLGIAVTSKARMRIRQGLKEIENREAATGRELLLRRFKNRKIDIDESQLAKVIVKMGFKAQTQFYHALSTKEITVDDVLHTYDSMQQPAQQIDQESHSAQNFSLDQIRTEDEDTDGTDSQDTLVIGENLKGIDYRLAGCCHPIYGDSITGFVSLAGIRIHRSECPNLLRMKERYPYRIIRARWAGKSGSRYSITLRVVGTDDIGIVSNITSIINKESDTLLRSISIDADDGLFQGQLTVMVNDLTSLKTLVKKIRQVKGVKQVERFT